MVAGDPVHTVGEFTVTIGNGLAVTVPLADKEEQLGTGKMAVVLVIITLYVPGIVEVKVATLPGLVAPAGTVHA
jgi:hypothetical protein